MSQELLIIGANAAGLSAAMEARRRAPELKITVLEAGAAASWSNCDLPYNLGDPQRQVQDLVLRQPEDFLRLGIVIRFKHRVLALDPASRQVEGMAEFGRSFRLNYDKLILASGALPRELQLPGSPDAKNIPALRSLQDLQFLKEQLSRTRKLVLLGGGPIAIEIADALCDSDHEITLIERGSELLAQWPQFVGGGFRNAMQQRPLQILLGQELQQLEKSSEQWRIVLSGGAELRCDILIHCAGIRPATDFVSPGILERDQRGALIVDESQQCSDPRVWAAGDCCVRQSVVDGSWGWNPQALDARRSGRVAGANAAAAAGLSMTPGPATMILSAFGCQAARCGQLAGSGAEEGYWSWSGASDVYKAKPVANGNAAGTGLLGQSPGRNTPPTETPGNLRHCFRSNFALTGHAGNTDRCHVQLECHQDGRLSGGALFCEGEGALRINVLTTLLQHEGTLEQLEQLDLAYTPRLGPAVDPLIQAARKLLQHRKSHT